MNDKNVKPKVTANDEEKLLKMKNSPFFIFLHADI